MKLLKATYVGMAREDDSLPLFLENDKKMYFDGKDLQELENLETLLYNLSLNEQILDLNIELNLPFLEKSIEDQVKLLLDKEGNND
jgi:hypothetical protein